MGVDQQPLIMRDFMGLGKLVRDDPEGLLECRTFPNQGLHPSSSSMDLPGVKQPVCNIGLSLEHNFPVKKPTEETLIEGVAESYGLMTTAAEQWQGMEYGTNRMLEASAPARMLGPEAYAKPNGTQLTIFYGGLVNVFNNISIGKAQELMQMAANGTSLPSNGSSLPVGVSQGLEAPGFYQYQGLAENYCINTQNGVGGQVVADQASQSCSLKLFECGMPTTPSSASSDQPVVPKALPLARKASLARFLERRKERMRMMMPYFKKQFSPAQGPPSTGEYMPSPFHGRVTLAKLYEEVYRRPSTVPFVMQDHAASHNDASSRGIPAKQ